MTPVSTEKERTAPRSAPFPPPSMTDPFPFAYDPQDPMYFMHHPLPPLPHPHIGMRKVKSIVAIFIGFLLWQAVRLFVPGLEVHPLFIYIYGMIEIRETSEKTESYGRMRIMATFTAIVIGLPVMLLMDRVSPLLGSTALLWLQIGVLILGALLVLCVAEWVKCRVYCGLAAAIYMILLISHFESSMYLYSIMRAFQTIIGVSIAWVINVKLLPYPPKPGSLSYLLEKIKEKRGRHLEEEK